MRKTSNITVVANVIFVLCYLSSSSQGCSDAGFCTVGILHQFGVASQKISSQKISFFLPVGLGDEKVIVLAPGIQYDKQINSRWAIQGKLTANYTNGNLGTTTALGDVFLSGIYSVKQKFNWATSVMLGIKLPMNSGNLTANGKALPMQYQSSLGSVDLITGLSTANEHWQFAAGWQQPLTGSNKNEFLSVIYDRAEAAKYPPSRHLNRSGDVLLRAAYTYKPLSQLSFNGGLLGIYHLNEDTYEDYDRNVNAIAGSRGLTLNITIAAMWRLNKNISVGVTAGSPLTARDVRPDGLTRKFVVGPEISWNF